MHAWGSHIEGAIQMVKARGCKQRRTKTGLLLFIAVRTQMVSPFALPVHHAGMTMLTRAASLPGQIIHTISSGTAPIMGVEWWLSDAVKDQAAADCQRLSIKTAELRAEVTRLMTTVARSPENVDVMLDLIRRTRAVDQECVGWMDRVPEHWQFRTVAWEDGAPANGDYAAAEVFPGRVDVYADFWIASVWNMVRTARLALTSITVRCAAWVCSPVDYRTTPEYAAAARTCTDTINDIIASVPCHLGWHPRQKDPTQRHDLSGFACGEDDSMKGLAGYFLTWPLATVASQDHASDAQRAWVVGRLRFIAKDLGVRYAGILAEVGEQPPPPSFGLSSCYHWLTQVVPAASDKDPVHVDPA